MVGAWLGGAAHDAVGGDVGAGGVWAGVITPAGRLGGGGAGWGPMRGVGPSGEPERVPVHAI
jgi:hypothetical protein